MAKKKIGRPKGTVSANPKQRVSLMLSPETVKIIEDYTRLGGFKSKSAAADEILRVYGSEHTHAYRSLEEILSSGDKDKIALLEEAFGKVNPRDLLDGMLKNPKLANSLSDIVTQLFSNAPQQQDLFNE